MSAISSRLRLPFGALSLRRGAPSWSRVRGLPELANRILSLYRREGIAEEEAAILASSSAVGADPSRIQGTLAQIFAGECPDDAGATVALAHELEERFGERLHADRLASLASRLLSVFARVFGAILGVSCFYLVLGGLLEGESERFAALPGPTALLLFAFSLAFLGLFEALHTSVTQLRLADLRGLADTHPRACALHRRFRDEEGISRFLAGRQIVVVITVFILAGLSSFPGMEYLPFTETAVPSLLRPVLELGIPGAMVVLWVAQLAPQFYATRRAVALMNTRPAAWALDIAFALEAMGVAGPSRWFSAGDRASDHIPVSPALQWEQDAEEVDGDGLLGVIRRWDYGEDGARLRSVSTTAIRREGHPVVTDSSPVLPGAPSSLSISADIAAADGMARRAAPTGYEEEPLATGDRRLHKPIAPAVGSFAAGDRVQVAIDAEYAAPTGRDAVHVERRARFLLWRLVLTEMPLHIGTVRLRAFRIGDGLGDLAAIGEEVRLEPDEVEPDEAEGIRPPTFSYALAFPPPNTLFVFDWEVVWR
ncbi:MAG TPA: hypothetical protein VKC63_07065 [Solirubrobacterales bacterium]|nr:hypothetical protein [Solirubrobacterales bacterium]